LLNECSSGTIWPQFKSGKNEEQIDTKGPERGNMFNDRRGGLPMTCDGWMLSNISCRGMKRTLFAGHGIWFTEYFYVNGRMVR